MANYNDGNIPYGSQKVTLNATDYVAEEIDFDEPTNTIDRRDEKGNPNGAVYIDQKITGRMTLQLSSDATPVPVRGSVANLVYRGAPKAFILTRIGQPQRQLDIHKIAVEIAEKLN